MAEGMKGRGDMGGRESANVSKSGSEIKMKKESLLSLEDGGHVA
jgi:hypothetical protein